MHTLYTITALSLDSFFAALIIGACSPSRGNRRPSGPSRSPLVRNQLPMALAFGLCDYAAAIGGSHWPHLLPEPSAAAIYLACAALLAWSASSRHRRQPTIYALPALLSVDNWFCGITADLAPLFGFVSAAIALAGFGAAALLETAFRTRRVARAGLPATRAPYESNLVHMALQESQP
jgi:hypothetical protein